MRGQPDQGGDGRDFKNPKKTGKDSIFRLTLLFRG